MKTCTSCGEDKAESDFYKKSKSRDGLKSRCKSCCNSAIRSWRAANQERSYLYHREWLLKRKYGLSLSDYEQRLAIQGGRCAICGTNEPGGAGVFHVDHSHSTGVVRELLCTNCNTAIGLLRDNQEILQAAWEYLNKHSKKAAA